MFQWKLTQSLLPPDNLPAKQNTAIIQTLGVFALSSPDNALCVDSKVAVIRQRKIFQIENMGLRDLLKSTIYRMDLFSSAATFRTRQQPTYETFCGGILSFLIMTVFFYFLYLQLADMLQNLTITYTSGIDDDVTDTDSITEFPFAVAINGVDLSTTPRKFIFQLYQYKLDSSTGGSPTMTQTIIPLSPCNVSDWTSYGSTFANQLNTFGFSQMLCITKGTDISLRGYAGSDVFEYLNFQIIQCNQTLDSSCDTTPNVNTYMNNYLSTNDYFKVRFFVVDTIIIPTNQNAITKVLEKNIFMAFSSTLGTVGYLNMAEYNLVTDTNLLPINSYQTDTGNYIEKFVSNAVSLSTTKYVDFSIYKSTKTTTIQRTIGKIDTVLSYVGGLFSLLFTAIAFFLGSYSQYKYELYVAESMMTDEKGKRVGADDITWYNYFFYCCYDWMDSFGVPPTCFTHLKNIHEMRTESCEQLDPAIILKRIKYVEDVSKILLKEHREMCLYLSEPLTITQAQKMRRTLFYYDQLIKEIGQQKQEKELTENQKFLGFVKNNAIANEADLQSSKPIQTTVPQKEPEVQLSEQEQKKRLDELMYSSLEKLDHDASEEGQKLKNMIPSGVKEWVQNTKKFKDPDTLQEHHIDLMVLPDEKNDESANHLQIKPDKNSSKISIKRAKR